VSQQQHKPFARPALKTTRPTKPRQNTTQTPKQGSPTSYARERETYRHALAATAVRPGLDGTPYLYTLNLSCPQVRAAAAVFFLRFA
jgi:hypothetical protein